METFVGHLLPGLGFSGVGLWHLYNHSNLHLINPSSYRSSAWFPTPKARYLELLLIALGSSASVSLELFLRPADERVLDPDGSVSGKHLHNFEHASISASLFVYSALAVVIDRSAVPESARSCLTQVLAAMAFGLELLVFWLHSSDHTHVEGQYHLLLQIVVFVSLLTTLLGIGHPDSFAVAFLRSWSIFFQGVWLTVMGFMLSSRELIAKGCGLQWEGPHEVVSCQDDEALHRAKALINIQFCWFFILVTTFSVSLYLVLAKIYGQKVEYQ
ncbi:hypothetical protein MLD38_011797 [Melastoma candidum]|uniref:Uncharacterized protein n=1 Tax=Melastoma candidum TaxID=119954 RepID=A0ACB9R5B7_9MYRT|nr:hypothetical protein MLD38_011797 [Melastoma candidum]